MPDRFPEIVTMGRATAERYEPPGEREVCISIRSPGEPTPQLHPRFMAVLGLAFADDQTDEWRERDVVISVADADRVIAFVECHRSTARRLVVHCGVGISRSASLARALAHAYRCALLPVHFNAYGKPFTIDRILNWGVYLRVIEAHRRHQRTTSTQAPATP